MSTPSSQKEERVSGSSRLSPAEETRAAIDVMFEALSHIQASLEESSEEARRQSYRDFKNALYRRFEQVVEDRQARKKHGVGSQEQQGPPADAPLSGNATASVNGTSKTPLSAVDGEGADGTLEKLWPTIATK
jgi:hypothetical protein